MPPANPRPPRQDEDGEGHIGPSMIALGGGGPIASREEPEEAQEDGRSPYQEMEGGDRSAVKQPEEDGEVQRSETVLTDGHPEEELETSRPETAADSCSTTEEAAEEMEIPSREETVGTSKPNLPQTGQGTARKHKLSKDREPTKLIS